MDINDVDLRCEQSVNVFEEHERLLALGGFVLVREKRHKIFRNSRGHIFVVACSPSDVRAIRNSLARLRRIVDASLGESA